MRTVVKVLLSVLVPVLLGVALVLLLAPLDPPDEGWGHTASHLIPGAVIAGILASGRRVWPRPASRPRRLLTTSLCVLAAAQTAEAGVAAAGDHDGTAHTAVFVVATLAVPAVLLTAAATAALATWRLVVARRPARAAAAPPRLPAASNR